MEEKKINKSIVFSIVAVLLLVIVVATSTYAYFRAAGETAVQEITTANLGINFVEGELFNAKLEPIVREDILTKAAKKTFTITNTGEEKLFVHISMEDMVLPEALKRYDFMWSLYEGDKNVSNGTFASATGTKVDVAPYQVFEKNATKTYHLYVWIEETTLDQNSMMGQTFNTKIKAVGETYHTTPETCFFSEYEPGTITGYDADTCGTDVIIPETIGGVSVTKIDELAFKQKGLTSVVIPNSVTYIAREAFENNSLTNVFIPNSVANIRGGAFSSNSLTNVSIPNSVGELWGSSFGNNSLTNVFIPNTVGNIDGQAFNDNKLTNIIIPNSVYRIEDSAFSSNQLTNVVIGSSVTYIGNEAFYNNTNLDTIVIRRANGDGITFGENWSGDYPEENVIYNPNY